MANFYVQFDPTLLTALSKIKYLTFIFSIFVINVYS